MMHTSTSTAIAPSPSARRALLQSKYNFLCGCARCVRDEWKADVQYANFSDARDKAPTTDDPDEVAGMLAGLPSYRVQDNPEYASLFPEASNIERRLEKSDTWGHDRDDEAPAGMGWGKYASGKE